MDCRQARELMVPHLAESDTEAEWEGLHQHLRVCASCRVEADGLIQAWNALAALPDDQVPAGVWERIQAHLPVPLKPVAKKFPWAAAGVTAALGALISIATSLLLPYERAAALCSDALRGFLPPSPIDPAAFFTVGFLYGLLPLGLTALAATRWLAGTGGRHPGLGAAVIFSVLSVPYVIIACSGLPAPFTASLLVGILAGALAGGAAGLWAGERFHAPAHT